jgi:hypothetical protein
LLRSVIVVTIRRNDHIASEFVHSPMVDIIEDSQLFENLVQVASLQKRTVQDRRGDNMAFGQRSVGYFGQTALSVLETSKQERGSMDMLTTGFG